MKPAVTAPNQPSRPPATSAKHRSYVIYRIGDVATATDHCVVARQLLGEQRYQLLPGLSHGRDRAEALVGKWCDVGEVPRNDELGKCPDTAGECNVPGGEFGECRNPAHQIVGRDLVLYPSVGTGSLGKNPGGCDPDCRATRLGRTPAHRLHQPAVPTGGNRKTGLGQQPAADEAILVVPLSR